MKEHFQEGLSKAKRFCVGPELPPIVRQAETANISGYGLSVQLFSDLNTAESYYGEQFETEIRQTVPDGVGVGLMNFIPFSEKDPNATRLNTVVAGLAGLKSYFEVADVAKQVGESLLPQFFLGVTSKELARITERIGFTNAERNDGLYEVVGEVSTVRVEFEKFMKQDLDQNGQNKILAMALRNNPELWDAEYEAMYVKYPTFIVDFDAQVRDANRYRNQRSAVTMGAGSAAAAGLSAFCEFQQGSSSDAAGFGLSASLFAGVAVKRWINSRKA